MADSLAELLAERALGQGDYLAYGFVTDGETEQQTITYGQLASAAQQVAGHLSRRVFAGGRVVLVFEAGLDFLVAFFGCQLAGVVAVPVYPPSPSQPRTGMANIARVVADCRAELILTSPACLGFAAAAGGEPRLSGVPWVSVSEASGAGEPFVGGRVRGDSLALLQYTSGSTGAPKGVQLRHEHLLANLAAMDWFVRRPTGGTVVSWLPMYHDMGLIGTVLYPLYRGMPGYLMSPLHFLQRPSRWLQLISRVSATISGGPSFAYQLCLRRAVDPAGLDLSSWEVAFNGAEPVNPEVLRSFERTFAPAGLRPGTVVGCYGMAEASLLITGARRDDPQRLLRVDSGELASGRVVECPTPDSAGRELVSCGTLPPGHDVRVVDPDSGRELPEGRVGEIWFHGPSLSTGYWRQPQETATAFGPGPLTPDGVVGPAPRYLRTGDLGFRHGGQLYVTGRRKDLLIVRGRNVYPQDIEETVQQLDDRLRNGGGVAVPVTTPSGEGVEVIQEATSRDREQLRQLALTVRTAVLTDHQVSLVAVHLVTPRSVLKTSSGKLRRAATAAALHAGEMTVLYQDHDPGEEARADERAVGIG
ncbi:fatty acyl-AMP ligase [Micromonospora sp. LOL_021]|uniref:fatty acyl-AMP ligase n=1 Tax=Micromonospora sp. LOL_021 TaxID=3345417 RepID=UPI003A86C108